MMRVVGLTGGIAMGKSTAARAFRRAHIPVFDADAAVRALQAPGGAALPAIEALFPGTVTRDPQGRRTLDRAALRRVAFGDPGSLRRLEALLHPMVRKREAAFLAAAHRHRSKIAVLDVPLLFEARGRRGIDVVVAVSAPAAVQRARVLRRGVLTEAQLDAVLARQLPDAARRRLADVVVPTGLSRHHAHGRVRRLLATIMDPSRPHDPRRPVRHRDHRPRPAHR